MDADGGCGCGCESVWFAVIVSIFAILLAIAIVGMLL